MTDFTMRLQDEKHNRLKALAATRGVSVNKLLDETVTELLMEYDAETRFKLRAARGDKERGLALLVKALEK